MVRKAAVLKLRCFDTLAGALLGAFIVLGVGNPVQATTYDFSFSNVNGAVNGTVSGMIVLPNGDGTFAASSVTIDAYPAALDLGTPPIDVATSDILENSFTVSGGDITSGNFTAFVIDSFTALFIDSKEFLSGGSALDLLDCQCMGTQGVLDSSSSTLTFAPAAAAVPEPATLPLFATGLGALGLLGWRRKRKGQAVDA